LHDIVLTRPLRRPFVGFDNYLRIFDDARFWTAVSRSTLYTVVCVGVTTLLAVLVALLLNEVFPGQRLLSALLLVPWETPSVLNGLMWKWIYDPTYGLLNGLLVQVGLLERYRVWLSDPDITLLLIVEQAALGGLDHPHSVAKFHIAAGRGFRVAPTCQVIPHADHGHAKPDPPPRHRAGLQSSQHRPRVLGRTSRHPGPMP
jgi:hypothetical protein